MQTVSMQLSDQEVEAITGYKRPADQCRWLSTHGIRATLNARNRCIVFRSDIENRQPDRPKVKPLRIA